MSAKIFTKKNLIIGGSVLGIGLLLFYFLYLPSYLSNRFKAQNESLFQEVKGKLAETRKIFSSYKIYSEGESNETLAQDEKELRESNEAIKKAKDALEKAKSQLAKTNIKKYFLINQFGSLKRTKETQENLEQYYKVAEEYLDEFSKVNDYAQETVSGAREMSSVFNIDPELLTETDTIKTLKEMIQKMNDYVAKLEKLTPPESAQEIHDLTLKIFKELVSFINELTSAIESKDEAKVSSTYLEMNKHLGEWGNKLIEASKKFQTSSKLKQLLNQTESLEAKISF